MSNGGGPHLGRARKVSLPSEDRFVIDRLESEALDLFQTSIELATVERARGRDDGEAVAGGEGARLQHARRRIRDQALEKGARP